MRRTVHPRELRQQSRRASGRARSSWYGPSSSTTRRTLVQAKSAIVLAMTSWRRNANPVLEPEATPGPLFGAGRGAAHAKGALFEEVCFVKGDEGTSEHGRPLRGRRIYAPSEVLRAGSVTRAFREMKEHRVSTRRGVILPRFRGHPERREDAPGVFMANDRKTKDVHAGVQGGGGAALQGRRPDDRAGRDGPGSDRDRAA